LSLSPNGETVRNVLKDWSPIGEQTTMRAKKEGQSEGGRGGESAPPHVHSTRTGQLTPLEGRERTRGLQWPAVSAVGPSKPDQDEKNTEKRETRNHLGQPMVGDNKL